MSRLNGSRCYLIGPIDNCPNGGAKWRKQITTFLSELGVISLDPTDKPISDYNEKEELIRYRKELKKQGDFEEITRLVKKVRAVDLRMCDVCDFCIVYLDLSITMCGTWEELFWCNRMKKPCLVVCEQGKNNIPDWLFGTIPHEYMFGSFDDVQKYLINVNSGDHYDHYNRWVFFNFKEI